MRKRSDDVCAFACALVDGADSLASSTVRIALAVSIIREALLALLRIPLLVFLPLIQITAAALFTAL